MKFYELTLEEELELMEKYSLTSSQFMIIKLLLIAQECEENEIYLSRYQTYCDNKTLTLDLFKKLNEKGIISKDSDVFKEKKSFYPEDVIFNKSFIKNFYKCSHDLGKELWEKYPTYIVGNYKNYPAKNFSKRFRDLNDLFNFYSKQIKNNPKIHDSVISSLDFAIKNDLITEGIVDYILSNRWNEHLKIMNGEDKLVKMTFDTTTML